MIKGDYSQRFAGLIAAPTRVVGAATAQQIKRASLSIFGKRLGPADAKMISTAIGHDLLPLFNASIDYLTLGGEKRAGSIYELQDFCRMNKTLLPCLRDKVVDFYLESLDKFFPKRVNIPVPEIKHSPEIRKPGEGFVQERDNYLYHLRQGTSPQGLSTKCHTFAWPIDMKNPQSHLSLFWKDRQLSPFALFPIHEGVDIQTEPGTRVNVVEDGIIIFAKREVRKGLADVLVYSSQSKILWVYAHLDSKTVPIEFIERAFLADNSRPVRVAAGDIIGRVGLWPLPDYAKANSRLQADMFQAYGYRMDHLHFQAIYFPLGLEYFATANFVDFNNLNPDQTINPLLLLERLY